MSTVPSYNYCAVPLAPYACKPEESQGRQHDEPSSAHRTCFQRDRDRIIHSAAFRRLQYKTQVFVYHEGDHYRTRLTHSLEVAQIARNIARALYVNEDLTESIALAHDLGHPAFAHKGEDALDACMRPYGGFKHNDQTVRVLTVLESRYPNFPGLNLSYETLEGLVKHNGPALKQGEAITDLPFTIKALTDKTDFKLYDHAHLEAQVVDIADDTAYFNHDVEDGLRAGFFTLDDLCELSMYCDLIPQLKRNLGDVSQKVMIHEMIREQMGMMIGDVIDVARGNLETAAPGSPDDVRHAGRQLVRYSPEMFNKAKELRAFLHKRMYGHYTLRRMAFGAERVIDDLFNAFMTEPQMLPDSWSDMVADTGRDPAQTARIVADYIAGMTDRYALREHAKLFHITPTSV